MAYNTIIVEDRIEFAVNLLPKINNFNIIFGCGDEIEMLEFLESKEGIQAQTPYPLVWLVYPYNEIHSNNKVYCENLTLLLVTRGSADLLNKDRLNTTYKKLLIPLYENIKKQFKIINYISVYDNKYKLTKFPNYSTDDDGYNFKVEDKTIAGEIWDVLKVEFECDIKDNCTKLK